MTSGVDPNDIYHNGFFYNRNGAGGPPTFEYDASGNVVALVSGDGVLIPVVGGLSTSNSAEAAAANVTKLQAALTAGGLVQVLAQGTYYINDTLVIGSNTNLVCTPGVIFKQFASINKNLLVNEAYLSATSACTVTWSAGNVASVAWTAHGLATDDFVSISGLATSHYNGVFPVTVVDANNFTVVLHRIPTGSPTGTAAIKKCDVNIHIDGFDYDYNYANGNNSGTQTPLRHGVILGHLAHSTTRGVKGKDVNKYVLNVGAAAHVTMYDTMADETNSDGIKVYGPAFDVHIKGLGGTTHDDGFSFHTKEGAAFAGYRWTFGDILSCTADGISCNINVGTGMAVLYGDADNLIDDVCIEGVCGDSASALVAIVGASGNIAQLGTVLFKGLAGNADRTANLSYCNFDTVTFDGVLTKFVSDGISLQTSGFTTGKQLICKGVLNTADTAGKYGINLNNITLEHLVIDGYRSANALASNYSLQASSGTIDSITISGGLWQHSSTHRVASFSSATRKINLVRNVVDGAADQFLSWSGTGTPTISMTDNDLDTVTVLSINAPCDISMSGNRCETNSNGVVRITGSHAVGIRSAGNNQFKNAAHVVVVSGTPAITIHGYDIGVDPIALTGLATTNGQFLTSTQAATEGGPAVRTAAGWVALGTGASGVNTVIA